MGTYSIVLALCASFIMAIVYTVYSVIEKRSFLDGNGLRHLAFFSIIGLLDACYLILLFIGAGRNSPYTIIVLINTPIVLNIGMKVLLEGKRFMWV